MQDIFLFERTGMSREGQGDRAVPRHRHPAEVRASVSRSPGIQLPTEMFEHVQASREGGRDVSSWSSPSSLLLAIVLGVVLGVRTVARSRPRRRRSHGRLKKAHNRRIGQRLLKARRAAERTAASSTGCCGRSERVIAPLQRLLEQSGCGYRRDLLLA